MRLAAEANRPPKRGRDRVTMSALARGRGLGRFDLQWDLAPSHDSDLLSRSSTRPQDA